MGKQLQLVAQLLRGCGADVHVRVITTATYSKRPYFDFNHMHHHVFYMSMSV